MPTNRIPPYPNFLLAQEVRLLDMLDGALPAEPPGPPAPTHEFLVMCLRPDDAPPVRAPGEALRSAA